MNPRLHEFLVVAKTNSTIYGIVAGDEYEIVDEYETRVTKTHMLVLRNVEGQIFHAPERYFH